MKEGIGAHIAELKRHAELGAKPKSVQPIRGEVYSAGGQTGENPVLKHINELKWQASLKGEPAPLQPIPEEQQSSERLGKPPPDDEFHSFATHSGQAFASMLSQTRKYGLFLCAAHQFWGQANQHLQEALQNTGIDVVFNVGRTDAEYTAKELTRIDPLHIKHEVTDEYAVEKTHPVFYNLAEQWQSFAEYLQDLPPRHFALKIRGQTVKAGKTRNLPSPRVDPQELLEVEQEYLRRYFRSKQEIAPVSAETTPLPVLSEEKEIPQALSFYQPINRRERLQ